jgi:hypothetical protein
MPSSITDERLTNYFRVLLKRVRIKTGRINPQLTKENLDFRKNIPLFKEPELQVE